MDDDNGRKGMINNQLRIESIYGYCVDNKLPIEIIDEKTSRKRISSFSDETDFRNSLVRETSFHTQKVYVARISDALLFGGTDAIIKDDKFLTDRAEWDKEGITQYSPWCVDSFDESGVKIKEFDKCEIIEKGISLVKMWSGNYYHFTFESLMRLLLLDHLHEFDNYPILIDSNAYKDEKNRKLIDWCNTSHTIVVIKPHTAYLIKDLIYPSFCTWGVQEKNQLVDGNGVAFYEDTVRILREKVLSNIIKKDIYKRVFIIRGDDRLLNESVIAHQLEQNMGFTIVNPDRLSIEDEISVFYSSEILIGVSGAAFTNIVYGSEYGKFYQICPMKLQYVSNLYLGIARCVGVDAFTLPAKLVKYGVNMNKSSFYIDPEIIEGL